MTTIEQDVHVLSAEFCDLRLQIDLLTGAPTALWPETGDPLHLTAHVALVTGGTEERGATGGLFYRDTVEVTLAEAGQVSIADIAGLTDRTFVVSAGTSDPDRWGLTWRYRFQAQEPRLAVSVEVSGTEHAPALRNLILTVDVALPEKDLWRIDAPGNQLRPGLPLSDLDTRTGVSPAGGLRGSVGLIAAERSDRPLTMVIWPISLTEVGDITLDPTPAGLRVRWQTDVAGVPTGHTPLVASALRLDLLSAGFRDVLGRIPQWLAALGVTSPAAAPEWAQRANIFEVQIGFSVFGSFHYSPYPDATDLLADLDRIQQLGYDTLQIMPRQPYPSYNVHDYSDITTSYGAESVLAEIVQRAHARGMHVILDILLHGVIDREAMRSTVAAIHSGPYADRLTEETGDAFARDLTSEDSYLIAWSRHIIDFEPYWVGGSPERHSMLDEHPEWFCRDSAGEVIGVYTKSFDVAHPAWQRYFIDACLDLVARLDVDGFRFDAPTYNYFHNWSPRTRHNSAVSMLGCLPLFDDLRAELKAAKPDALLYTEPSGVLLRQAMDLNYNYDEQWLISAVMGTGEFAQHGVRDAVDLGSWLADRDASLPVGSVTAHHIDSHDTFWWPALGQKWRREQYTAPAAAAWMTVFALSGGPFMTFVGGETGIESSVLAVNGLRLARDEFVVGVSDYKCVTTDSRSVYAVVRRAVGGDRAGLLLVNLSAEPVLISCSVVVDGATADQPGRPEVTLKDQLGGEPVGWAPGAQGWSAAVSMEPYQTRAFSLDELATGRRNSSAVSV